MPQIDIMNAPALLLTESDRAYKRGQKRLAADLKPWDELSRTIVRLMFDQLWRYQRAQRHKALAVNAKHKQLIEREYQRAREYVTKVKADERLREEMDADDSSPEVKELLKLIWAAEDGLLDDTDTVLKDVAAEETQAAVLQGMMNFHAQLDAEANSALKRFQELHVQLEMYRASCGTAIKAQTKTLKHTTSPKLLAGTSQGNGGGQVGNGSEESERGADGIEQPQKTGSQ